MTAKLAPNQRRPRGRPRRALAERPTCPNPDHVTWSVQIARYERSWGPWEIAQFRCVPPGHDAARKHRKAHGGPGPMEAADPEAPKPHIFEVDLHARHPGCAHPHGERCWHCGHKLAKDEGSPAGRSFTFAIAEIAEALSKVAGLTGYRAAGRATRANAIRYRVNWTGERSERRRARRIRAGKPVRDHSKSHLPGEEEASNQSRLVASWVDAFAPILLAPHEPTAWPARVGLDSQPLTIPRYDETGRRVAAGLEMGEVLIAMDLSQRPGKVLKMAVAGGKDSESWAAFLRSIPIVTPVELVVADRGSEIAKAVSVVFPTADLYQCEGHLEMNAQDAAKADGCYDWIPNPNVQPNLSVQRPLWLKKRPDLIPSPLYIAIDQMQHNPERWADLEKAVAVHVPANQLDLRTWMANNKQLVFDQMAYRKAHRGIPRGAGAAEAVFADLVRMFKGRTYRNAKRLDLLLGLYRLHKLGKATPGDFAAALQRHFEANGGRSGAQWDRLLDKGGSSIVQLIIAADERQAERMLVRDSKLSQKRQKRTLDAIKAERAAAGQDPIGRKLRAAPSAYRRVGGLKVADLPDVMEKWDWEANGELDPTQIAATNTRVVGWICRGHENLGHVHHYTLRIVDRATDPNRQCPYCANRRGFVCPTNNFAHQHPALAAEWHPTKNGDLKPTDFLPAAMDVVWWLCTKCPRKHAFQQRISARSVQRQGCPKYAEIMRAERNRASVRKQQQRKRALMREVRAKRATVSAEDAVRDEGEQADQPPDRPRPPAALVLEPIVYETYEDDEAASNTTIPGQIDLDLFVFMDDEALAPLTPAGDDESVEGAEDAT